MNGPADLSLWRHDDDFRSDPVPLMVLDRELVIRAVNAAHERATGFPAAALLGRMIFEAYPANPLEADGDDGCRSMAASFEQVLRHERPHDLVVQRYDVPLVDDPGRFLAKTWLPVNAPVWAAGVVGGIVVRAEEVVLPPEAERRLRSFREALRDRAGADGSTTRVVEAVVWGLRTLSETTRETDQLRRALTSRATIDQAKGILMARRRIDADEAFRALVLMSNETNVPLAEVAKALVYQATRAEA